jgi:hypothetical protein
MARGPDPSVWLEKILPEEFPGAIREVFDFLCRDHGFREPLIERTPLTLCLSYRARRVAVEVDAEFRDRAVEVALVWLPEGKRPDGWKIDGAGRQIMIRLFEAEWHRKVPSAKVAIPDHAAPRDKLRMWLEAWAEQLRVHFADVLADSDALFVELNRARRKG